MYTLTVLDWHQYSIQKIYKPYVYKHIHQSSYEESRVKNININNLSKFQVSTIITFTHWLDPNSFIRKDVQTEKKNKYTSYSKANECIGYYSLRPNSKTPKATHTDAGPTGCVSVSSRFNPAPDIELYIELL